MSSFSPYSYQMSSFPGIALSGIESYYTKFTFLSKKDKRNTYKVSLAQLLHYFIDFGIGYDSACSVNLKIPQQFNTCLYVNKHQTTSHQRPATISDLKEKILDIVNAMIRHTVKTDKGGIKRIDIIYPTYYFTLDENLDSAKLKQLTGKDYVEVDFTDFVFTDSISYNMPMYEDGYVPIDSMLACPNHNHEGAADMSKSIKYKWGAKLKPTGHTMWSGHAANLGLLKFITYSYDKFVNPCHTMTNATPGDCSVTVTPAWEKPTGVSCFQNKAEQPLNTVDVNGTNFVSIRYPGRRYRLFKLVGI